MTKPVFEKGSVFLLDGQKSCSERSYFQKFIQKWQKSSEKESFYNRLE